MKNITLLVYISVIGKTFEKFIEGRIVYITLLVYLSVIGKTFEKFIEGRLVYQLQNYVIFLISIMVSGLSDQLQNLRKFYLISFLVL